MKKISWDDEVIDRGTVGQRKVYKYSNRSKQTRTSYLRCTIPQVRKSSSVSLHFNLQKGRSGMKAAKTSYAISGNSRYISQQQKDSMINEFRTSSRGPIYKSPIHFKRRRSPHRQTDDTHRLLLNLIWKWTMSGYPQREKSSVESLFSGNT